VGLYRNLLWVWHRLDSDRWEKSQVQLRVGKSKANAEVDHVVSFALWEKKLQSGLPKEIPEQEEALSLANRLGNCSLLEKNFNISKSDKTLKLFLSQIHEVRENKIRIDAWCAALAIPQALLDPSVANVDEIMEAIENRDKEIRTDLADFVRGQRVRVDADTPLPRDFLAGDRAPLILEAKEEATAASAQADGRESSAEMNVVDASSEDKEVDLSGERVAKTGHGIDLQGLRAAYNEDVRCVSSSITLPVGTETRMKLTLTGLRPG
jgi:hypothetical protein